MSIKPITGQYECVHKSGVGLDYFTSRVDRLILQGNGHFSLTTQHRSRAINAAQALISGQQATSTVPETRLEGQYVQQGTLVTLHFDNGGQETAQLAADNTGMQVGPNFFTKVSDSTLLPPTSRMKQDMEDIAKGLKIASALGGMALKAAKTIQNTVQTTQETTQNTASPQPVGPPTPQTTHTPAPQQPPAPQPLYTPPAQSPAQSQPPAAPHSISPGYTAAVFCDQCGARSRPGKRFCNNCGAQID